MLKQVKKCIFSMFFCNNAGFLANYAVFFKNSYYKCQLTFINNFIKLIMNNIVF